MHIKLEFKVERRLGDPLIRIMVDDTISTFDGPCHDMIEFDIPLTIGDHELRITHYGKQTSDHVYDELGNILIDKHVEILKIWFDKIELKQELWDGSFFPVYNPEYVKDLKSKNIDIPYSIKPNLYLGHNGTWQLNFEYPAVEWLVNQRQNLIYKVKDPDFLSQEQEMLLVKNYFENAPELKW